MVAIGGVMGLWEAKRERVAPAVPAPVPETDEALLGAIAGGDRAAFRRFHTRHAPRIQRFLVTMLRRHDLAEEVANDVMLAVWRSAGSFEGQSKVTTWLHAVAFRTATKALRRFRLEREAVELESLELADPDSAEERRADPLARAVLAEGLAALPAAQRLVLDLAYVHGHSCSEIATITGAPIGTVKARLQAARARLAERFEPGARVAQPATAHPATAARERAP